jgi:two-component system aerobic respiration control sensor histidine kinase ArcB
MKENKDEMATIESLRKKIHSLQMVLDSAPGDIYWKDKTGIYLGLNRRGFKTLQRMGIDCDDVIGKTDAEIFGQKNADVYTANDAIVLEKNHELALKEETWLPSGEREMRLSTKTSLRDENGEIIGIIGNSIDITQNLQLQELLEAKERAERSDWLKTEFIRNMCHDIRTPFNGMLGILQIAIDAELDHDKKSMLSDVYDCANALHKYCEQIVEIAKVRRDFDVESQTVHLAHLVDAIVEIESISIQQSQHRFELILDPSLPETIVTDERRIKSIILNLLSNAIKFTPPHGHICLEWRCLARAVDQCHMEIIVRDNGIGIPKSKQADIFEDFVRLNVASNGRYHGTGLGLSFVKQYAEDLDMTLNVRSNQGLGTAVSVIFSCSYLQ